MNALRMQEIWKAAANRIERLTGAPAPQIIDFQVKRDDPGFSAMIELQEGTARITVRGSVEKLLNQLSQRAFSGTRSSNLD